MRMHPQEAADSFSAQVYYRFRRESGRIVGFQEGGGMRGHSEQSNVSGLHEGQRGHVENSFVGRRGVGRDIGFASKPTNKLCCFVGVLQKLHIAPKRIAYYKVVLQG